MPLKTIKLVIFDLDGTLVNAYPAIIKSFNYTLLKLHYPKQDAGIIRRTVGWGDENLLKPFVKTKDLKAALAIYRRHHAKTLIKGARLLPKAGEVLSYLKGEGKIIAVASNRPTRFSWILIRGLGLKKYLDYCLCADKLKHAKPHPEILNKILQRFSVRAHEAVYVGDMAIDAQAGRRANIKTIIVTTGSSTRQEIQKEKPFRIIVKLADLFKLL